MPDTKEPDTAALLALARWISAARENQDFWSEDDYAAFALEMIQRAESVLYGS